MTPFRVKQLEKMSDFTDDATFLQRFLVDRYQTWYVYIPKHRAYLTKSRGPDLVLSDRLHVVEDVL